MAEYPPELVDTIVAAMDAIPADLRPSTLVNRDRARAALDAITAGPRAIVDLPEQMTDRSNVADSIKDQPMWLDGDSWACLGVGDMEGLVEFEADSQNVYGAVTRTGAKTLAAVLLAAVAERGETGA